MSFSPSKIFSPPHCQHPNICPPPKSQNSNTFSPHIPLLPPGASWHQTCWQSVWIFLLFKIMALAYDLQAKIPASAVYTAQAAAQEKGN